MVEYLRSLMCYFLLYVELSLNDYLGQLVFDWGFALAYVHN